MQISCKSIGYLDISSPTVVPKVWRSEHNYQFIQKLKFLLSRVYDIISMPVRGLIFLTFVSIDRSMHMFPTCTVHIRQGSDEINDEIDVPGF